MANWHGIIVPSFTIGYTLLCLFMTLSLPSAKNFLIQVRCHLPIEYGMILSIPTPTICSSRNPNTSRTSELTPLTTPSPSGSPPTTKTHSLSPLATTASTLLLPVSVLITFCCNREDSCTSCCTCNKYCEYKALVLSDDDADGLEDDNEVNVDFSKLVDFRIC